MFRFRNTEADFSGQVTCGRSLRPDPTGLGRSWCSQRGSLYHIGDVLWLALAPPLWIPPLFWLLKLRLCSLQASLSVFCEDGEWVLPGLQCVDHWTSFLCPLCAYLRLVTWKRAVHDWEVSLFISQTDMVCSMIYGLWAFYMCCI